MKRFLAPAALVAAAVALAACGDDGSSTGSGEPASAGTTVTATQIDGQRVLVDADGHALYTTDAEANGEVRCTGACTAFWEPLTLEDGQPTGDAGGGVLGVVERPDGTSQVTVDDDPVYRFTEDEPGEVSGDEFSDTFDGEEFTWHVVATGGEPAGSESPSGSGGPSDFGY